MEDLSEKEQMERLRAWWNENGNYVLVGVVLGVGLLFSINWWRGQQLDQQLEASARFESLAESVGANRLEQAETIAAEIYGDYGDTIYADQTRLAMARLYMDQGRDQDAARELEALVAGDADENMRLVARARLARIYLYQDRPEDAIDVVEDHVDNAFAPRFQETLGDAYYELGRWEDAEAAYMAALEDPRANQLVNVDLIRMKINDLPDATVAADVPAASEPAASAPAVEEAVPVDSEADAGSREAAAGENGEDEESPE